MKYHGNKRKPSSLKKMPKPALKKIRDEFVKIVKGVEHTITVDVPATKATMNVRVVWLSDIEAEIETETTALAEDQLFMGIEKRIMKQVNEQKKLLIQKHTATIKKFVDKADNEADKFDVVREDLWDYLVGEV